MNRVVSINYPDPVYRPITLPSFADFSIRNFGISSGLPINGSEPTTGSQGKHGGYFRLSRRHRWTKNARRNVVANTKEVLFSKMNVGIVSTNTDRIYSLCMFCNYRPLKTARKSADQMPAVSRGYDMSSGRFVLKCLNKREN